MLQQLSSPAGGLPRAVPVPAIAGDRFLHPFGSTGQDSQAPSPRAAGQSCLPQLVDRVKKGQPPAGVKSAAFHNGGVLETSPGQFLDLFLDSDRLPSGSIQANI